MYLRINLKNIHFYYIHTTKFAEMYPKIEFFTQTQLFCKYYKNCTWKSSSLNLKFTLEHC